MASAVAGLPVQSHKLDFLVRLKAALFGSLSALTQLMRSTEPMAGDRR